MSGPSDNQIQTRFRQWSGAPRDASDEMADGSGLQPAMDDLAAATALIETAVLPPEREPEREQVLDFCRRHDDALFRSCLDGHLTGSAFVVDSSGESVLLIHHRKLGRWLQPGGHADGQGNLAIVALSEVREETGLEHLTLLLPAFDIDVHVIPARPSEPEHLHLDLRFVMVADSAQSLQLAEGEVYDAKWFRRDDPDLTSNEDVNVVASRALAVVNGLSGR